MSLSTCQRRKCGYTTLICVIWEKFTIVNASIMNFQIMYRHWYSVSNSMHYWRPRQDRKLVIHNAIHWGRTQIHHHPFAGPNRWTIFIWLQTSLKRFLSGNLWQFSWVAASQFEDTLWHHQYIYARCYRGRRCVCIVGYSRTFARFLSANFNFDRELWLERILIVQDAGNKWHSVRSKPAYVSKSTIKGPDSLHTVI